MDDNPHDGAIAAAVTTDPDRYARVARLVNEALQAANQATLEPEPPSSAVDSADDEVLMELPTRVPWLDVVADLAIAAGYLADIPLDSAPVPPGASEPASHGSDQPENRCRAAIQAAAGALDALPGPRAHRDVMVRIALTGALRSAQTAERRP